MKKLFSSSPCERNYISTYRQMEVNHCCRDSACLSTKGKHANTLEWDVFVVNCKPIRGQFVSYWPIGGHFDVIASHKSAAVTKSCNYRHFQVLFWARTIWCLVHCNNCTTHRPPPTQKFLILNIFKTNIWTFYMSIILIQRKFYNNKIFSTLCTFCFEIQYT